MENKNSYQLIVVSKFVQFQELKVGDKFKTIRLGKGNVLGQKCEPVWYPDGIIMYNAFVDYITEFIPANEIVEKIN